jgi:hypothetical protein
MKTKIALYTLVHLMNVAVGHAQIAEKIVLTTDKHCYYPGESLWFSLNIFDACHDTLSDLSKVAYVELVGSDNKPAHQMKVAITDAQGSGSFTINENVPTGNYSVVAYTNWMKNFGVGSYSRLQVQIVNPLKVALLNVAKKEDAGSRLNAASIRIEVQKKVYAKREHIPVNVIGPASSRLSVSVFRRDALQGMADDIVTEESAIPCEVDQKKATPFILEDRGHVILGRIIDKRSQLPAAGIRGYLSVIDSPNDLFVATSDSIGNIRFEVGNLSGRRELVLQTNSNVDSNYTIELITPYSQPPAGVTGAQKENVFELMPAVVNDALVSAQVQRYFYSRDARMKETLTGHDVPFYGKPDDFYLTGDYVQFSTVEEILREYVTTVGVQRRNGRMLPVVYDVLSDRKPFSGLPLVLVNGVPFFELDRFFEMNTDEIRSIGVVAKRYFVGHQMFYGIIDIRLDSSLKNFGRNATVVDYDGVSGYSAYYSPKYENESEQKSRKPDFRNVLYWNARMEKDKTGKYAFDFYSSDLEGEYAIVVRAVSETGIVETSQTFIQVK